MVYQTEQAVDSKDQQYSFFLIKLEGVYFAWTSPPKQLTGILYCRKLYNQEQQVLVH
jgi:hypothetical protein